MAENAFSTPGQMQVQTPAGPMMVQVPADKKPGDIFTFSVPAPVMPQQPVMAVAQVIQPQMAPQMAVAGYPATGHVAMMVQPVVAMAPVPHNPYFSRVSTMATCIHCQHTGLTNVQYDPGCGAWLVYCALSNTTGSCVAGQRGPSGWLAEAGRSLGQPRACPGAKRSLRRAGRPKSVPPCSRYSCCGLAAVGCWMGCCLIPFCIAASAREVAWIRTCL